MTDQIEARDASGDTVAIATIHPGQVSAYYAYSLVALLMADQLRPGGPRVAAMLQEWSGANVSEPRNNLVREFLDNHSADWMLWIDSDMAFPAHALDRLLAVADPVERPIVGGLCFGMSDGRLWPTLYRTAEREDGATEIVRVSSYPPDTVVRVIGTGAAFLLVHRSVLAAIRDAGFSEAFPWFAEAERLGRPVGEDLTLCLRAGRVGASVWVDTGLRIGHHKSALLDEPMFLAQAEREVTDEVPPDL